MTDPGSTPVGGLLARAVVDDAPELLVLQRCCWVSEAITNDTLDIPPLHEDLHTVRAWVVSHEVWTVRLGARLVAAVRAHLDDDRWEIGRLMVAPDQAGHGLGRWLLEHVERRAPPEARRLVLFTGSRSERNLRLYGRAGYLAADPPAGTSAAHIHGAVHLAKAVTR